MPAHDLQLKSLAHATDIDVLPDTSEAVQRDGYVVVRTPTNPTFHGGNYLIYPHPPEPGCRARWEADFAREIAERNPGTRHVGLCWDSTDGSTGAMQEEFVAVGYEADPVAALVALPEDLVDHPGANAELEVRALDPLDDAHWNEILELQVETRPEFHSEAEYRPFAEQRLADYRARFASGSGTWFGGWLDGELAGSMGIVVTHGRARFQAVDTLERFRRRGVARRMLLDVARYSVEHFGAERFVIVAEVGYHALPLYTSMGFVERERVDGVRWWPSAPHAALHPTFEAAASG